MSFLNLFDDFNKGGIPCAYCPSLIPPSELTKPDAQGNIACKGCSKETAGDTFKTASDGPTSVKVPCRYVTFGCTKKFTMNGILDHERACDHRIYQCIAKNCAWEGTITELRPHILNSHPNIILRNGCFRVPLNDTTCLYVMYMNDEIFLVQMYITNLTFFLSVKYIGKPADGSKFEYTAEIRNPNTKQTPTKLYNGKMKVYSNFENLSEKTDVEHHIESLDIWECSIKIGKKGQKKEKKAKANQEKKTNEAGGSNATPGTENKNKSDKKDQKKKKNPKTTPSDTSKDAGEKEQKAKPNNGRQNDIIREFECPVCQEYMFPPIMICASGHSICSDCKSKLTKCPTCLSEYGNTRNYTLENMANLVQLPCRNEDNGCNFVGNLVAIQKHKILCKYDQFVCPIPYNCKWVGTSVSLNEHLANTHKDVFVQLNSDISYDLNIMESQHNLIKYKGELYRLSFKHGKKPNGIAQWSFQKLNKTLPTKDCKIEINFHDETNNERKFIINDVCRELTDYESIFNHSLAIPLPLLEPYICSLNKLGLSYNIY